jgi:endogenous inhibitor of DNA gyrase (YacG/DUF329 family)
VSARYKLAPFLRLVGNPTHADVAAVMGVTKETVHAWAARGMGAYLADRLAVAYGRHPVSIWPSWFDDSLALPLPRRLVRPCARCGTAFERTHPRRRFCSVRCKNLESSKQWKLRNPEIVSEYRHAYYAECGDYERARQRGDFRKEPAA